MLTWRRPPRTARGLARLVSEVDAKLEPFKRLVPDDIPEGSERDED
jgi:hypothetical protein